MRPAQRATALAMLILVAAACANTPDAESSRYWTARRSFVDIHETWNDALRMDNDAVRAGADPMFNQRSRDIAQLIIRMAYETFEETEPLLGDPSKEPEILLAISKVNTLAFQLSMLFAAPPGGTL